MSDRATKMAQLAAKAKALPKSPGVYLFKDAKGVVLYVGKALVLPNRVGSYFQASADLGPRKQPMLDLIDDFDVIECEGEWEALLAENRLIKDLHPKYNASMTDDRSFPYLVITLRDDFPGVFITRQPGDERYKGAKVIGPFTNVAALRESVKMLQRVFKFRTCELDIREDDPQRRFFRPCLLHPIHQCTAPCAARISKEAYRADIDRFVKFIESKRSVMLREMRAEMEAASKELAFEKAATLRDQIKAIEKLSERGKKSMGFQPNVESFYVDPRKGLASLRRTLNMENDIRCVECIDIAHLQGQETVGSKVCFVDGRPCKSEYRKFRIRTAGNDDFMSIREVVSRAYREAGAGHQLYPEVVIIDGGIGQLGAAMDAFAQLDVKPPKVISLAKKEELIYTIDRPEPIKLGRENPGLKLCQSIRDEAHRFAQSYHHVLRRKKVIGE
ncbi:MAG: excinuclease ABC subunit UvrC [Planctomycetes bacterium]|nr:excinuclease ABC subunit UvrC [Planctomycetota bacterium]